VVIKPVHTTPDRKTTTGMRGDDWYSGLGNKNPRIFSVRTPSNLDAPIGIIRTSFCMLAIWRRGKISESRAWKSPWASPPYKHPDRHLSHQHLTPSSSAPNTQDHAAHDGRHPWTGSRVSLGAIFVSWPHAGRPAENGAAILTTPSPKARRVCMYDARKAKIY